MRVVFEGGRSWRVRSTGGATVAIDPAWLEDTGWTDHYRYVFHPPRTMDHRLAPPIDVAVVTGTRPEQLDLQTLHLLDRRVVVVVSPLIPAVAAEAIEVLGFVTIRAYFEHDFPVGDLVLRFLAPGPVATAALPDAGLVISESGGASAFLLRGDCTGEVHVAPPIGRTMFDVSYGGTEPATRPSGEQLRLGPGVRHPTVDRSLLNQWPTTESPPSAPSPGPVRAGDSWDIEDAVKPAPSAAWVSPGEAEEAEPVPLPLSPRARSDSEGRHRHQFVLDALPALARDLTLYPPGGRLRAHWTAATHDGLGPKTFLLTLVEGPGGTRCQYALDVTRSGFVPVHEPAETAPTRFPCGVTLCFDDFVALLRGEMYAGDVFGPARVWSHDVQPDLVRQALVDLFTASQPYLLRNVLVSQANALVAQWATAHLAGRNDRDEG